MPLPRLWLFQHLRLNFLEANCKSLGSIPRSGLTLLSPTCTSWLSWPEAPPRTLFRTCPHRVCQTLLARLAQHHLLLHSLDLDWFRRRCCSLPCPVILYLSLLVSTWVFFLQMRDKPTCSGPFSLWNPPAPSTEPCSVDTQILADSVQTPLSRDALPEDIWLQQQQPGSGVVWGRASPLLHPAGSRRGGKADEAGSPLCPEHPLVPPKKAPDHMVIATSTKKDSPPA